ncbi:hypothetical protein ACLB2K_038683 [Fragaria x ananassa]
MVSQKTETPPVAKKVEHKMELLGDVRVDNYYWLRDDSRSDPDVLSYLEQENDHTNFHMSGTKKFEQELYSEIRGRMKEDDISAPERKGHYCYYTRTLKGQEYVQHCRRLVPNTEAAPHSVHDTMPMGPGAPPEHVILDENIKAQTHAYYSIAAFKVSPNNKLVAYAEDTKGNEIYTVYVIDADTGAPVGQPLVNVTNYLEWAGDQALAYVTMDATLRPDKAWLHKLGTEQSTDSCLYHEKDDMFSIELQASESKRFLFVASESKTTRFNFYLDALRPEGGLVVQTPRQDGIDTSVSHRGNHFFMKRRSDQFFNSEVIACPVENTSETTVLIPHRESVKIQDLCLFNDHLVIYEREDGLPKITIYNLPDVGQPLKRLQGGQAVNFSDPTYSVEPSESEYSSSILRYSYSSMKIPPSVYDYDMKTGISVLKKIETVLGGFEESKYVTERKWATATDGTQIPISIVYRKDIIKLDGSDPLLLYGYGSYEICIDACFKASRMSLLDRGFIFAIAHIRGGGEMGRKCIHGRSAGGLLIGAVLNMRPDLFKAAVAGVPFVDVLTTMLDPTIPLTTSEWEEWGDPRREEFYYMKSYSPVDNVKAQNYPNILVTAGLNDPRVMYSEPAKFVAKLRDLKTDKNILLFKCELGAGHFSKSGRFEKLEEDAFTYSFVMKALDMIPDHEK